MQVNIGDGRSAAGPLTAIEHGQLAKKISRLQLSQRDVFYVVVINPNPDDALLEDVERVAAIVFVEDGLAGFVVDLVNFFSEVLQFLGLEPFEKRYAREGFCFVA